MQRRCHSQRLPNALMPLLNCGWSSSMPANDQRKAQKKKDFIQLTSHWNDTMVAPL